MNAARLVLDPEVCVGHGRCYALAPDLVDADDQGHALVLVESVPAVDLDRARAAVANCPEGALTLTADP